ncbi:hypothetical protein P7C73_g4368, partial [Tremellales sp. Uapishka_1]
MPLILLPSQSDAFSAYRPSKNAHVDIMELSAKGKRKDQSMGDGIKVVRLCSKAAKPVDPERLLSMLETSIEPILSGKTTDHPFHHLSAACRTLVLMPGNFGKRIHDAISREVDKSAARLTAAFRGSILARETGWLARLVDGWKLFEARTMLLASVFVYLDRVYCTAVGGAPTIRSIAISTFRTTTWEADLLSSKTRDEVLRWVADTSLRPIITSLTTLANLLSVYERFSETYLEETSTYYERKAEEDVAQVEGGTMSPTKYVEWVLDKVGEERERAASCMSAKTGDQAVDIVRKEAALEEAMTLSDAPALKRLYQFAVDVDVFPLLRVALQSFIETRLKTIISDPANDSQMIESTLALKRFTDRAVADLFPEEDIIVEDEVAINPQDGLERSREMDLEDAIRNGFKTGMGSRQNAPAEWIAKHLDATMRKGQAAGTEAEFNTLLDEIIALIGFTRDKDVFKAFYSTGLAKRLLLNKSASDDMERNMILKLQTEMGEEFTSGDVMMKDLQLSETLVKSYQSARAKTPGDFKDTGNLTANVLTESAWPAYPLLKDGWNFTLTPELQSSIDAFTSWYSTQHKNRKLSWRYQLATVTMSARFPAGRYEIGVSLFQAVVLLQFNEEDSMKFKEIKERTGIESTELIRTLQSLSIGRKGTRVLIKKPAGKEVDPSDVFNWNKGFSSERIKFKINQIQQDLSAEESKKTNEQVAVDRVSVLEATIVRIMKARKKMTLQLLIDAVVTAVNKMFPPDIKEIKKRVESLIEREFLMRDEDDRNLLHYLA